MNYLKITDYDGRVYCGGNQSWFDDVVMINSGCGIVAALDNVLLASGIDHISKSDYKDLLTAASKTVRPRMFPFKVKQRKIFGGTFMGSFGVTFGILRRKAVKLAAGRGLDIKVRVFRTGHAAKVTAALKEGRPVIMLITAPLKNLRMYWEVEPKNVSHQGFHWVTIIDEDDVNYIVSSWGERYLIPKEDVNKVSVLVRFALLDIRKN